MMKIRVKSKNEIKAPIYKTIKISELETAGYQRGLSSARVKRYSLKFDPDIFGVPLVSYRGGRYYIVDGQHRIELLKLLGVTTVLCQVIEGLTYEEEAEKFVKLNCERGGLTSNQKFHGRVESKDDIAMKIVEILSKNGLFYAQNAGLRKDNYVNAISCVEDIFKSKGERILDRTLNIVKSSWYGDASSMGRDMIRGVATFISESKGVKDNILISGLERTTPNIIVLNALVYAGKNNISNVGGGASKQPHVAKVIRDIYFEEKARYKAAGIR